MAVTTRTGNDYRVIIGKETAYGSGKTNVTSIDVASEVTWLTDRCEFTFTPTQIDTRAKSGVGLSTPCEFKPGYQTYTVTLSGYLSNEHEILLKAFTGETESTYDIDGLPTLDGYVIERVWSDTTNTPLVVDKAVGCQLRELSFTGASNDMVRYEAVFAAKTINRETTQAFTGAIPARACAKGYNFGDVTGTLNFGDTTHLKSFSLKLTNETPDDASMFQNSNTLPTGITVAKVLGELNYVTNYYSTATDKAGESKVYSDTPLVEVLVFNNTVKDWTLTMNTQVTSYSLPEPESALFENNVTSRLVYTTGANPLSIAVA
jgi:hypothetical protein